MRSIVPLLGLLALVLIPPVPAVAGGLVMEVPEGIAEGTDSEAAPEDAASSPAAARPTDDVDAAQVVHVAEVAGVTAADGSGEGAAGGAEPMAPPVTVPDLIVDAAGRYGLSSERMLRIAWCESRWDPSARGPGGAAGVFQFVPNTWTWASAGAGVGGQSPYDASANVEAAAWVMATQGFHHWGCR